MAHHTRDKLSILGEDILMNRSFHEAAELISEEADRLLDLDFKPWKKEITNEGISIERLEVDKPFDGLEIFRGLLEVNCSADRLFEVLSGSDGYKVLNPSADPNDHDIEQATWRDYGFLSLHHATVALPFPLAARELLVLRCVDPAAGLLTSKSVVHAACPGASPHHRPPGSSAAAAAAAAAARAPGHTVEPAAVAAGGGARRVEGAAERGFATFALRVRGLCGGGGAAGEGGGGGGGGGGGAWGRCRVGIVNLCDVGLPPWAMNNGTKHHVFKTLQRIKKKAQEIATNEAAHNNVPAAAARPPPPPPPSHRRRPSAVAAAAVGERPPPAALLAWRGGGWQGWRPSAGPARRALDWGVLLGRRRRPARGLVKSVPLTTGCLSSTGELAHTIDTDDEESDLDSSLLHEDEQGVRRRISSAGGGDDEPAALAGKEEEEGWGVGEARPARRQPPPPSPPSWWNPSPSSRGRRSPPPHTSAARAAPCRSPEWRALVTHHLEAASCHTEYFNAAAASATPPHALLLPTGGGGPPPPDEEEADTDSAPAAPAAAAREQSSRGGWDCFHHGLMGDPSRPVEF